VSAAAPGAGPEEAGPSDEEIAAFSAWLHDAFGYDFREYYAEPLRKCLRQALAELGLAKLAELERLLAADRSQLAGVLAKLTVMTSTMFRNPRVFAALTREVFPYLRTYSSLKIWHAGCARGEEVFSLAILLAEHGLLERARVYATDINPVGLEAAREGIYPARRLKEFTANYQAAGGARRLSDYFEIAYGHAKISRDLAARVLFSKHDLVGDTAFGEMQLIVCRNVMIYFTPELQQRVLNLLRGSLSPGGFLCLGLSEALLAQLARARLTPCSRGDMIFRSG
jgi:chemotaxis protein methyltransferase CheR